MLGNYFCFRDDVMKHFPHLELDEGLDKSIKRFYNRLAKKPIIPGSDECAEALTELGINFSMEYTIKPLYRKRYDFFFEYHGDKYLLEFDGGQHFFEMEMFKNGQDQLEKGQYNDIVKTYAAKSYGYKMIRIDCTQSGIIKSHIQRALERKEDYYFSSDDLYLWLKEGIKAENHLEETLFELRKKSLKSILNKILVNSYEKVTLESAFGMSCNRIIAEFEYIDKILGINPLVENSSVTSTRIMQSKQLLFPNTEMSLDNILEYINNLFEIYNMNLQKKVIVENMYEYITTSKQGKELSSNFSDKYVQTLYKITGIDPFDTERIISSKELVGINGVYDFMKSIKQVKSRNGYNAKMNDHRWIVNVINNVYIRCGMRLEEVKQKKIRGYATYYFSMREVNMDKN